MQCPGVDELECISSFAHGRYDHPDALVGIVEQQARDASEAIGIAQAAATEFVDFPATVQGAACNENRE